MGETLFEAPYRVAMARDHRLAAREAVTAEELAGETMIVRRHCEALPLVSRFFAERGVRPFMATRAVSDDRTSAYVAAGLGASGAGRAIGAVLRGLAGADPGESSAWRGASRNALAGCGESRMIAFTTICPDDDRSETRMTAIAALPGFRNAPFSIVTVGGADRRSPAWERMFGWPAEGAAAVPLAVRSAHDRTIWAARLDRAVREADARVLLVADGLGCAASAWWARLSPADYVGRIAGALLFAPPAEAEDGALFASPRARLPFPSLVIQPGGSPEDVRDAVQDWGSRLVAADRPRDRATGIVAWRQAQRLFLRLTEQMVEHDVDRGRAITGWR